MGKRFTQGGGIDEDDEVDMYSSSMVNVVCAKKQHMTRRTAAFRSKLCDSHCLTTILEPYSPSPSQKNDKNIQKINK